MISKSIPPRSMIFFRAERIHQGWDEHVGVCLTIEINPQVIGVEDIKLSNCNNHLTELESQSEKRGCLPDLNSSECSSETCAISSSLTAPSYSERNNQIFVSDETRLCYLSMFLPEFTDQRAHVKRSIYTDLDISFCLVGHLHDKLRIGVDHIV